MKPFQQTIKNSQKGAAMVEFAIIVPLLLLLVIGICEIGYGFYHLNILTKSVQDGARYFSDPLKARKGDSEDPIDTSSAGNATNIGEMQNLVIYGNIKSTVDPQLLPGTAPEVTVSCAEETVCSDTTQHIRVTATYQHNLILGAAAGNFIPALGTTGSYTLTASTVLRVE